MSPVISSASPSCVVVVVVSVVVVLDAREVGSQRYKGGGGGCGVTVVDVDSREVHVRQGGGFLAESWKAAWCYCCCYGVDVKVGSAEDARQERLEVVVPVLSFMERVETQLLY